MPVAWLGEAAPPLCARARACARPCEVHRPARDRRAGPARAAAGGPRDPRRHRRLGMIRLRWHATRAGGGPGRESRDEAAIAKPVHGPRAGRGGAARNRPPVAGPTGIAGRARGEEATCCLMHLKPAPAADPPRLPPRAVGRPEQRRASGLRAVVDVARLLFALHPRCRSR
jgi:hypothetical protein